MRWFKAVSGLLVMVLLVSGCIRVDANIKIDDDGSGQVDFLTAIDAGGLGSTFEDFGIPDEELGGAGDICEGFSEDFGTDASSLPAGADVTDYNEDGFCGTRVKFALAPSTDHSAAIADLFDEETRLYKEGDNWFFESGLNADEITSSAEGAPPDLFGALFENASFKVTIDLPGRAVDGQNNATTVGSDGVFIWEIDILNPPTRLFAQTEPGSGGGSGGGGGGLSPVVIAVIVIAIAAVAALAWFVVKGRSKGDGAAPVAAMPITAPSLATSPPVASTPPFSPTPPPGAMPPPTVAPNPAPVMPQDTTRETVVMSAAEAQRFAAEQAEVAAAAGMAQPAAAAPQPVYDETLGAWVIDDPARGRMRHDPTTGTWLPL